MADEENTEEKKKKKLPLIPIIGVIVLLLGGAGGYFFLFAGSDDSLEDELVEIEHIPDYKNLELSPFVVNLAKGASFLKIEIILKYDAALITQIPEEVEEDEEAVAVDDADNYVKEQLPLIRDIIIGIISSKTRAEVMSEEGKIILKEEILEGINEALGLDEGPVTQVMFVDFLSQG